MLFINSIFMLPISVSQKPTQSCHNIFIIMFILIRDNEGTIAPLLFGEGISKIIYKVAVSRINLYKS